MEEDAVTARIIACAIKVHKALGPGLLESAYQISMEEEFKLSNLQFKSQVAVPLIYNGRRTKKGYRIDFLVEERVQRGTTHPTSRLRAGSNLFEVNASAG